VPVLTPMMRNNLLDHSEVPVLKPMTRNNLDHDDHPSVLAGRMQKLMTTNLLYHSIALCRSCVILDHRRPSRMKTVPKVPMIS
jgi:hypothetical protein